MRQDGKRWWQRAEQRALSPVRLRAVISASDTCTVPRGSQQSRVAPGSLIHGKCDRNGIFHLILMYLNCNLNSYMQVVATKLDSATLNC